MFGLSRSLASHTTLGTFWNQVLVAQETTLSTLRSKASLDCYISHHELLPHWRLQTLQIIHNPPCPFKNQWLNFYQHATKCRLFHLLLINTHCALDPGLSGLYASVFRATPNRTMKLPVSVSLLSHSAWLPPLLQTSSPSVKSWLPPWLPTYCSSSSHGCVLKNANKPTITRKLITVLRKPRQVNLCEFLDSLVHIMSNRISMVT